MPLGGFDRDFKKAPTTKIIKEDNGELYENLQTQLQSLQKQIKSCASKIKELNNCVTTASTDTQDSFIKSLDGLKQDVNNLQQKQISLSLAASRALTEMANLLDSKFEELKETQVKVDYKAINLQFKKIETIITQQKLNIQLLTSELKKSNPWIPVLIGCAIGLSGVLGYVVSLI